MLCIGHRGARGHEPENTLRSVACALTLGADWIEIDVHAVEGRLVVIHDDRLERTTNGTGYITGRSLDYLRSLDAGGGEKIPFLDEVFLTVGGRAGINVELKGADTAEPTAQFLHAQLDAGWDVDRLLVSSFNHHELKKFSGLCPRAKLGALIAALPLDYAAFAERLGAYSVNPAYEFIDAAFVQDAHRRGIQVFAFTVNDPEDIERMIRLGVDGIFSDYPERVIAARSRT